MSLLSILLLTIAQNSDLLLFTALHTRIRTRLLSACSWITLPIIWNLYMLFAGREVRIGKNCARGLTAYGLGPCSRPRVQFFPIRTDLAGK